LVQYNFERLFFNKGKAMSDLKQFTENVIAKFAEEITDKVFLMIEGDRDLMKEYLDLVDKNSLMQVNTEIGKVVKSKFCLDNKGRSKDAPQSKLIQSYEKHKPGPCCTK
jgi:hypothetical protein